MLLVSCQILNYYDVLPQELKLADWPRRRRNLEPRKVIFVNVGIKYRGDFDLTTEDIEKIWSDDDNVRTAVIRENSRLKTYNVVFPLFSAIISVVFIATGYWFFPRRYNILIFKVLWHHYYLYN